MSVHYFREKNGDYFAVETTKYRESLGNRVYEGRGAGIAGQVGSVCTVGVHYRHWRNRNLCTPVNKEEVPPEWLKAIGLEPS
jgi:hypothetical protein